MSEPDDGPLVGMTGARFGGTQRRRKRRPAAEEPATVAAADSPAAPPANPVVGRTGARFARVELEPVVLAPEPVLEIEPPAPVPEPVAAEPEPVEEITAADGVRVRPYVLTGGRTRASRELPIESLVSVGLPGGPAATLEQRQVVDLCTQPRSIAEVAALVRVPLGVARVLVADLADTGAVTVHATVAADVDLMRRVLAGLHRL